MAAILKTFAGLNFYTRTCFIDYYHISFKKSHQTLRPRSCRVNQNFDISWILDLGLLPPGVTAWLPVMPILALAEVSNPEPGVPSFASSIVIIG